MFRRTDKPAEAEPTLVPEKVGGKGHATPTRKQAQAAAKERARAPIDTKASKQVQRQRRAEASAKMREAMRTGEERYLPARDKGPVKRFVRDFVDARLTIVELMFPLLVVVLVLTYGAGGNIDIIRFANVLMEVVLLVAIVNVVWLLVRVKRALRRELPDESARGVGSYAVMRAINPRFMRQPKPQVRVGGRPKEPKPAKARK